jgi:hypothetical protein
MEEKEKARRGLSFKPLEWCWRIVFHRLQTAEGTVLSACQRLRSDLAALRLPDCQLASMRDGTHECRGPPIRPFE